MAKLKVYASPQGFYDTVVAAPSQKAALEAWGTHQNLFADGMASVVTDPATVAAALANPGQVLRRPAGAKDPFKPGDAAARPKAPKSPAKKPAAKLKPAKAAPKPPPDRSALDEAEKALAAAEAAGRRELSALDREREDLEARQRDAIRRRDSERRRLKQLRDRASRAYVKAGGKT